MPWISRILRGERVLARCDDKHTVIVSGSRVDIIYKPGGKIYRAAVSNLSPDPNEAITSDDEAAPTDAAKPHQAARPQAVPTDAYLVWADGACIGNPGPAGLGIVILDGKRREEHSEYLGEGTNNIAELMAVKRAIEQVDRRRSIVLHTDSAYAIGLLDKGWKAKANQTLVADLRALVKSCHDFRLVKVKGHAGVTENERADSLANQAARSRRTHCDAPDCRGPASL